MDADEHAFACPGDACPDLYVHGHAHPYANIHADNHANVDAGRAPNGYFHISTHVDANSVAQPHAAAYVNTDRTAYCHANAVYSRQRLEPRSRRGSRLLGPAILHLDERHAKQCMEGSSTRSGAARERFLERFSRQTSGARASSGS
jgi:hypothetical protein